MPGARCATFSVPTSMPVFHRRIPTRHIIICSSKTPLQFLSKSAKRKNYLRPKILKTLTKPSPPQPSHETSTNPVMPFESPETAPSDIAVFESLSDQIDGVEVFPAAGGSVAAEDYSGVAGKFSKNSILKYGLYFLGFFAFQTICAVWVMGNANTEKRDRNGNLGVDEENYKNYLLDGDENYYNGSDVIDPAQLELQEKIQEIRAMARDARRTEQKEHKDASDEEEDILDESLSLDARVGIEKEIGSRLVNLEKRLNSKRKGFMPEYMQHLVKSGGDGGEKTNNKGAKEDDGTLMFKKKYKFKGPSMNSPRNVQGFPGLDKRSVSKNNFGGLNGTDAMGRREKVDLDADLSEGDLETLGSGNRKQDIDENLKFLQRDGKQDTNEYLKFLQKDGKHFKETQKKKGTADANTQSGRAQGTDHDRSSNQDTKPRTPRGFGKKLNLVRKLEDKKSDAVTDLWWLNLSYVVTILMRRGLDGAQEEGLFTLRTSSQGGDSDKNSYIVAFEDHGDANNFCHLLEAFFLDLGDFSADIVPISTKDLRKAMESGSKKVIVVGKRQLKLYAGQPFEEVERVLYSLIEDEK